MATGGRCGLVAGWQSGRFSATFARAFGIKRLDSGMCDDANGFWGEGQLMHSRWFVRDIRRASNFRPSWSKSASVSGGGHDVHDGLGQQCMSFLSRRVAEKAPETLASVREAAD